LTRAIAQTGQVAGQIFDPQNVNYTAPCSCAMGKQQTVEATILPAAETVSVYPNPSPNGAVKLNIKGFDGNVNIKVASATTGFVAYSSKQFLYAKKPVSRFFKS